MESLSPPVKRTPVIRTRLREATRDMHAAAERRLDLDRPSWTVSDYIRLLTKLWGFYTPLERALAETEWDESGLIVSERAKRQWIEADLMTFGITPDSFSEIPLCTDLPTFENFASVLGGLYVVEGATLGGQIILRTLHRQLGVSPDSGGRFFASYGRNVGGMWREYLEVLESVGEKSGVADEIERLAIASFSAFDRWFSTMSESPARTGGLIG